jgi:thioredoxin 1
MGNVINLSDENFEDTINKNSLVLVDFWAEWCYPCKMVAPTVEELAKEFKGKLVCAKLNVDENPSTAMKFQITSIPTLLLFKEGKPIDIVIGAVPKSYFVEKIKPHL